MDIRLLTALDAKSYWDLRLEALKNNPEAFSSSYEEAIRRESPVENVLKNLSTEGTFTFGAFNDKELIGVVTLVQESTLKLHHRANIFAMYVCPKFRGLGVGKALISTVINHAKSIESLEKINLEVITTNDNARHLYINMGFKTYGIEKGALKINNDYYDSEYMELFLKK
ncbi:GNAT family N-acetyltransferase [Viridibacillus sp. NPDC093762]|uniref:GNAT family N-acetyltransferase n=1 Tax=Viridibacillus sp. NPDC093762 TaxID=3390720 RepID=UPI003D0110A4